MTDRSPWRHPSEETSHYPGLWVHDGRQTGSITFHQSRLPLWATTYNLTHSGWDGITDEWDYLEDDYGWDADQFSQFLHYLFQLRGDFGRLICALANAERVEQEREADEIERQAPGEPIVRIDIGDGEGVTLPPPWWQDADLSAPVVDLLRRCLAVLDGQS